MIDFEKFPRFKFFSFQIVGLIPKWSEAYRVPFEAVERQIGIAHVWCDSNPRKAPKKDPVRFLNNWMRLAQKMGNLKVEERRAQPRVIPPEPDMTMEEMRSIRIKNFPQYKYEPSKFKDIVDTQIEENL